MCGIVGYVGPRPAAPILVDGLRRLEYRGYDSAGLAVHSPSGIEIRRAVGKLRNLEGLLFERPLEGTVGIGHTRWATHGRPSEVNAHPHVSGDIAVVHNGIIENHVALRRELKADGFEIQSETDTELVAHLVQREVRRGKDLLGAVLETIARLQGAYAIAVLDHARPDRIVVARASSPLVVGLGEGENFCASDVPALLPYTREMIFLEDGDVAVLEADRVQLFDVRGETIERPRRHIDWSPAMAEKAGYKHFMLKEIFEQPRAIEDTLRGRLDRTSGDIFDQEIGLDEERAKAIRRVVFLACGTSHHATIAGRYWTEELAGIPAVTELASEFRGRNPIVGEGDLVVAVSQSGETIDTLVAAREAKKKGATVLAVVNVIDSAIARMADAVFYTHAGPEIGVASTKCFTAQLANLLMLSIWLGRRRGHLSAERCRELVEALASLPQQMQETLQGTRQLVANLAKRTKDARDVLFLGRGLSFPIALEGALKLKEISYVHAEGYAAGEMKHGPIALIDEHVPVFVLVPEDDQYERSFSNLQEAKARDARVIAVATSGDEAALDQSDDLLEVPRTLPQLTPFVTVLPLQLFAYYVADFKGTDVDQPRNLAKTVTVE
ncbi:MAG: glutamine--fructose-6-phosphate transaminase (isomerizing) [Myxococcales bacterium]|nr:glutamine--fructose-6-phosphate transaminase (isomerizing) [Myxococcales bacterium]